MYNLKSIWIKLFILTATATLFLASQFTSPSANEKAQLNTSIYTVPDTQFIVGAFHNGVDTGYTYQGQLNLNTWHHYTGPYWGWLSNVLDHYDNDISLYQGLVTSKINRNNNTEKMRTFMDRPIIEYLVGGQRIDYQCENIAANFQADPYWFYAYNHSLINNIRVEDMNDNTRYGNGERVKWCKIIEQNPLSGYLLIDSGLRSNREMSFNQVNQWLGDTAYNWYVLPRIRIDSVYAADTSHFNDEVCKIVFTGWKGNVEAEFSLKVSSFRKNKSTPYNGNYMESFYQNGELNLKYLTIDKSKLKNFTDTTKFVFEWKDTCKCDIKIYWTGKCNMWIDRVRIENLPAHQYLTLKENWLYAKVDAEIGWANTNNQIPNYFYFEECQMSHFPVIKELNRQIDSVTGGKNALVIWLNYDLFKAHVPDCWNYQFDEEMLKSYIYTEYGLRNIVMGSYALEGWETQDKEKTL